MGQRYYIETLGCPKNQVDSDKIAGTLIADGLTSTDDPSKADVVIVNIDQREKPTIREIRIEDSFENRSSKPIAAINAIPR